MWRNAAVVHGVGVVDAHVRRAVATNFVGKVHTFGHVTAAALFWERIRAFLPESVLGLVCVCACGAMEVLGFCECSIYWVACLNVVLQLAFLGFYRFRFPVAVPEARHKALLLRHRALKSARRADFNLACKDSGTSHLDREGVGKLIVSQ